VLRLAVTISAILLCVLALQWTLIDWFTPFLVFPLLNVVWVVFAGSAIASVVHLVRSRWRAWRPLAVQAATLALAVTVPFTSLWIDAQRLLYAADRQRAVALYREGRLRSVRSGVQAEVWALPDELRGASKGGGEIVAYGYGPDASLLFFTYRGILSRFSGFIYRPDGSPPPAELEEGEPFREIERVGDHWFFVAH
jgi:hypothetical protein